MTEIMNKISILGCGWLGLPLAKSLLLNGYEVKGSTTSESKLEMLKKAGIIPFQIQLTENNIIGNIEDFLNETDVLLIDIPPGLRRDNSSSHEMIFVNKIKKLIPLIENSEIQKVIFVSSTSVYGDSFPIVKISEETKPNPDAESGKQLAIVEELLQSNSKFKTTILRFGGLLGENRHPIHFLAGRTNLENPDAPINLIHQEDCIGIIKAILKQVQHDNWGEIYNAVAPQHPTRKEYYQQKAIEFGLDLPHFNTEISFGKLIKSDKIIRDLNYSFRKEI